MTNKLNPSLGKIMSPVILVFPDGSRHEYEDGAALAKAEFEIRYAISSLYAVEGFIHIELNESERIDTAWIGEEQVSLFDG